MLNRDMMNGSISVDAIEYFEDYEPDKYSIKDDLDIKIPNVFMHKRILNIGARPDQCALRDKFSAARKRGVVVDLLEVFWDYCFDSRMPDYFDNVFNDDIVTTKLKLSYDVVIFWHGMEHIDRSDFDSVFKKLENMAKRYIVHGVPWGVEIQNAWRGNEYQAHKSNIEPKDFQSRGYHVVARKFKKPTDKPNRDHTGELLCWKKV